MSYRQDMYEMLNSIVSDLDVVEEEIFNILDMDNIEDIKIAMSDVIQTIQTLKEELQ